MKKGSQKSSLRLWCGTVGVAFVLLAICPQSAEAQNTFPGTGHVGIGTSTPTAPFTISTPGNTLDGTYYSTMTIRKTGDTFSGIRFDKNSTALFRLGTDQNNNFQIGRFVGAGVPDDGAFYINQSGNVGIGTTSPQSRLHVYSPGDNYILSDAPNSSHSVFSLRSNGTETGALYRPAGTNDLRLWAGADRLTVLNSNGHVGIGSTDPQSNVQIGAQIGSATANPSRLSLGGTYSSMAGNNLKLRLYDDGIAANIYGLGVSVASMDFGVSPTAGYNWYSGGTHKMTLSGDGNLGIGTGATPPSAKLHVAGDVSVTGTGNITAAGTIEAGNIKAKYQDLAEWVESSQTLAAGTVVVLDHTRSNQVVASSRAYDTRVAGVISVQPGIALGESGAGKVLVATTGRVKIKVDATAGPIRIGDLLVTSDVPGVAMKSEPIKVGGRLMHMPGTLIGKALEPLAKGSEKILVLLSLQ